MMFTVNQKIGKTKGKLSKEPEMSTTTLEPNRNTPRRQIEVDLESMRRLDWDATQVHPGYMVPYYDLLMKSIRAWVREARS